MSAAHIVIYTLTVKIYDLILFPYQFENNIIVPIRERIIKPTIGSERASCTPSAVINMTLLLLLCATIARRFLKAIKRIKY